MARVTGFTAERMLEIENSSIVSGAVLLDDLVLTQRDGTEIVAGNVRGPKGDKGDQGIQGIQGIQGVAAAITAATASGLAAGAAPTVTLGGNNQARTFAFGIPQGAKGDKGDQGIDGVPGSLATPAGTITLWGSDVAPANWLICDGSAVSRTTYASLFAVIGTKYGAGDGVNTFNLPNLKGQTPIGKDAAQTEFAALNQKGGEKKHQLTIAEMPAHTHKTLINTSQTGAQPAAGNWFYEPNSAGVEPTTSTGGDQPHNILQPYTVVNFIIKVTNGDTPGDSQLTQRVSNLESFASNAAAGTITIFGGDTPPTNWLLCDGSAISRTTYASLFAAIGTKYGSGDGSTTFNLPNFKGKVPAGLDVTQAEFNALGKTGGTKTHNHQHFSPIGMASNQLYILNQNGAFLDRNGSHYDFESIQTLGSPAGVAGGYGGLGPNVSGPMELHQVTSSDSGTLQPYLTVNYIIKFTNGDTQGDSQLTQRVSGLEAGTTYSMKVRDKMRRLEHVLTGGGIRKVSINGVYWSERFIVLGAGKDAIVPSAYWDITVPPAGTVIPVYNESGRTTATVAATGWIPLTDWGALYYELPLGSPTLSTDFTKYRIVGFSTSTPDFTVPENWILICARNTDPMSPALTWGDGRSQDFWKSLGLTNGWINYSGNDATIATNYGTCAWRWSDDGKVVMRGLVANGAAGLIVQLPNTIMGPDQRAIFIQNASGGICRLDVTYDAGIYFMNYLATGGSGGFVSLEGIEWYPRQ